MGEYLHQLASQNIITFLGIRTKESQLKRNDSDSFPSVIFNVSLLSVEFEIFFAKIIQTYFSKFSGKKGIAQFQRLHLTA